MRLRPLALLALAALVSGGTATAPALAADGADSPAAINRYAKALAGDRPCTVTLGTTEHRGNCRVVRGGRDGSGIWTYHLTLQKAGQAGRRQQPERSGELRDELQGGLTATLTPHMAGATVQAERSCGGQPRRYAGDLRRKGKSLWQGTLTAKDGGAGGDCAAGSAQSATGHRALLGLTLGKPAGP